MLNLDEIEKIIDDNIDNHLLEYDRIKSIIDYQNNKIKNYIDSGNVDIIFKKLFDWERKFEDIQYKKGIETSSNIFNHVFDIISKDGIELNFDEDFLASSYEYKGYIWKLYCGQGSFIKVISSITFFLFIAEIFIVLLGNINPCFFECVIQ